MFEGPRAIFDAMLLLLLVMILLAATAPATTPAVTTTTGIVDSSVQPAAAPIGDVAVDSTTSTSVVAAPADAQIGTSNEPIPTALPIAGEVRSAVAPAADAAVNPGGGGSAAAGGQPWRGQYVVQAGDRLFEVARRFNTTVPEILTHNPEITDPDRIYPNQTIFIP